MPFAFHHGASFSVVLESDRSLPEPPTFQLRHLTGREVARLCGVLDSLRTLRDGAAAIELIFEAVEGVVIGWTGLPVPFEAGKLRDVLTLAEANDLLTKAIGSGRLAETDRKNS